MNFFKSVFSDDSPDSPPPSQTLISADADAAVHGGGGGDGDGDGGGGWSFGGLMQTIASKSETIIETYRRDLQEFNDGLKTETQVLKTVAATKAQVSLESVGKAVDSLGSAVSEIISLAADDRTSPQNSPENSTENQSSASRDVGVKYSRYEAQLRKIQSDEKTYVEENVDELEREEYERWKLGFDYGEYEDEAKELLNGVAEMREIYERVVVAGVVEKEVFWMRYFYRVDRLKKTENVRARLVNRAFGGEDDEEDLSWDVDDDHDNELDNVINDVVVKEGGIVEEKNEAKEGGNVEVEEEKDVAKEGGNVDEEEEEEEVGWDEIEDVGSGDDEKRESSRGELGRRVSVVHDEEDDEDLSWDIEDDDEPIKKASS